MMKVPEINTTMSRILDFLIRSICIESMNQHKTKAFRQNICHVLLRAYNSVRSFFGRALDQSTHSSSRRRLHRSFRPPPLSSLLPPLSSLPPPLSSLYLPPPPPPPPHRLLPCDSRSSARASHRPDLPEESASRLWPPSRDPRWSSLFWPPRDPPPRWSS